MNELSLLIYGADIAATVNLITAMAMGPAAVGLGWTIFRKDTTDQEKWDEAQQDHARYPSLYPNPPQGDRPAAVTLVRFVRPLAVVLTILVTVNVIVPSAGTLYAIAASEMGERVLNSETGGKAVQALNAWLDKQIAK